MTYKERKANWFGHAQGFGNATLEIMSQCDRLDTAQGTKDRKLIAPACFREALPLKDNESHKMVAAQQPVKQL
jgi:hypothetical protein